MSRCSQRRSRPSSGSTTRASPTRSEMRLATSRASSSRRAAAGPHRIISKTPGSLRYPGPPGRFLGAGAADGGLEAKDYSRSKEQHGRRPIFTRNTVLKRINPATTTRSTRRPTTRSSTFPPSQRSQICHPFRSTTSRGRDRTISLGRRWSFALLTTALGLTVAIPLTLLGAWVQVRIGKLTDAVQEQVAEFMHDLEDAMRA